MKKDLDKLGKSLEYNNAQILVGSKDLTNKLNQILRSNNIMNSEQTVQACNMLNTMEHEDKISYILEKWGQPYLDKCMPILISLKHLNK